jgi:hypothetical protein
MKVLKTLHIVKLKLLASLLRTEGFFTEQHLHRTASAGQLSPKPRSQSQLEAVHQGSMREACHRVDEICDSKTKSILLFASRDAFNGIFND